MKPEIAKIWIDALRSGEYTQGKQALKVARPFDVGYHHCCLGVLCELYDQNNEEKLEQIGESIIYFNNESSFLPEKVCEWAGLNSRQAFFRSTSDSELNCLAKMNDDGFSFEEIADVIEQNVKNL